MRYSIASLSVQRAIGPLGGKKKQNKKKTGIRVIQSMADFLNGSNPDLCTKPKYLKL